ncbi:YacL family protein, partial [Staphylococcus aureus]|nr:YacL family protein [Staphylococcus aureus]
MRASGRWVLLSLFIFIPPASPAFFLPLYCDNYPNGFAEENTMDYEFLRDITGVVKVRMSMGHEAVGHW